MQWKRYELSNLGGEIRFFETKGGGKSDDGRAARKLFAAAESKALHRSGAQLRSD